jgi:hypothetical protein
MISIIGRCIFLRLTKPIYKFIALHVAAPSMRPGNFQLRSDLSQIAIVSTIPLSISRCRERPHSGPLESTFSGHCKSRTRGRRSWEIPAVRDDAGESNAADRKRLLSESSCGIEYSDPAQAHIGGEPSSTCGEPKHSFRSKSRRLKGAIQFPRRPERGTTETT